MTIIKYFEWLKILPTERKEVYELCTRDPQVESGYRTIKILDKRTALSMIRENALPLVHSDRDGMIWESAPLLPCPISHYNTNPFFWFLGTYVLVGFYRGVESMTNASTTFTIHQANKNGNKTILNNVFIATQILKFMP